MDLAYREKSIKVVKSSVVPAIKLNFTVNINYYEIPLKLTVQLYSEDNKFLANLEQINNDFNTRHIFPVLVMGKPPSIVKEDYTYEMIAVLNKQVINYIEEIREKNKKNDVVFNVKATMEYLETDINIEYLEEQQTSNQNIKAIIRYEQRIGGKPPINILTSPGSLFTYHKCKLSGITIAIPSSDWRHDFQEPLGIGRFMAIEIPELDPEDSNIKNIPSDIKILVDRISNSKNILKCMEKYINEGEWGRVIEESRKFFELYDKDVKRKIKEMIINSTGISYDSATKFTTGIDNLFSYSSALHHSVSKEGNDSEVNTAFTGGKEDAYLIFNLCASILNLVSNKVSWYLETHSN